MTRIAIDARKLGDFGIGSYVEGLIRGYATLDSTTEFLLLAPRERHADLGELPANFRWIDERAPAYSLSEQLGMGRRLAALAPDLFHSPHYVLPAGLRTRVVVTVHDLIHLLFPEFLPHPLAHWYARFMLRRAVRRGDRILTGTAAAAEDLARHLAADRGKLRVVAHGVDERFRQPIPPAQLAARLARFGLTPGYLLAVGNPKPHKNLAGALAAFAAAGPEVADRLVLLGGARLDRPPLAAVIRALGLGERVAAPGRVAPEELPAFYQGAALLLLPSLYEGFGLPVAEAMASGTPVVASTTPAVAEVAGDAAELVDPRDIPALAERLRRLAADPARRAELARRGRARADRWRWETSARQTLAVYREAMGLREPAR